MQKAFEDATYALEVGELSQPIFSDSGAWGGAAAHVQF